MRELLPDINIRTEYLKNEKPIIFISTNFDINGALSGKQVKRPSNLKISYRYVISAKRTIQSGADILNPKWNMTICVPSGPKTMFPISIIQNVGEYNLSDIVQNASNATDTCWTFEGEFEEALPPENVTTDWIILRDGEGIHINF